MDPVSADSCKLHDGKCSIVQLARKKLPMMRLKQLIYNEKNGLCELAHSMHYS
jgi:hypothetical protein